MSAFDTAWGLLKSRTYRDQSGGLAGSGSTRTGEQGQPFTHANLRQRVPLVGAQRVDENFAERSDTPQMGRRGREHEEMMRNMGADKEPMDSFDEEVSDDEFHEANENLNRRALEQMLMGSPKKRTLSEAVQAYPEEMPFEEYGYGQSGY